MFWFVFFGVASVVFWSWSMKLKKERESGAIDINDGVFGLRFVSALCILAGYFLDGIYIYGRPAEVGFSSSDYSIWYLSIVYAVNFCITFEQKLKNLTIFAAKKVGSLKWKRKMF